MIKIINYFFQSIIIYMLFFIGRLIGITLSRKIFSFLFLILGPLFKSKIVIEKNLNIFSKDMSEIDKKEIITNMWKNYGMTFIEYIFLDSLKNSTSHLEIDGFENLKKIIKKKNQAIFVSGHFANFELMSMEIGKVNIDLATIYRPLNNFFLNPFMEYLRKRYICNNQIRKGINGVRETVDYIKNGKSIALMIDQRVSEGEKINFFGKPAFTTTLPAQLALKYDLPIIPVFIKRTKNNFFKLEFLNEVNPSNFKDKNDLTKKLNNVLEKMILDNPGQWIWTHNRWK